MAKPKFAVSPDQAFWVILYFSEAFKKHKHSKHLGEKWGQAQDALSPLYQQFLHGGLNQGKSTQASMVAELKIWLETYIPDEVWTCCLAAVRQRHYCQSKRMKTVKIPASTHYTISEYAKQVNLPIWKAISQLAERESDQSNP